MFLECTLFYVLTEIITGNVIGMEIWISISPIWDITCILQETKNTLF